MDEQHIERVGQDVAHLNLADHILSWDKKQSRDVVDVTRGAPSIVGDTNQYRIVPNPDARRCQADPSHGCLTIHGSGVQLICGVTRPTPCDYAEPVSR